MTRLLETMPVILEGTTALFNHKGTVHPVLFMDMGEEELTILPVPMRDNQDKNYLSSMIEEGVQEGFIKEYALLTESWSVIEKKGSAATLAWLRSGNSLSQHPDRQEIVSILYAGPEHEFTWVARIERPEGQPPRLGPWEKGGDTRYTLTPGSSRYSGVFARARKETN